MATNVYLHADPIKGESTDDKHKDWIEVTSFNHGLSQPVSGPSGTGGRASARADFSTLNIMKLVDKASVDLNVYCAQGKHIAKLELEVCQETGEKVCFWKYEMENAMVSAVQVSGGGSDRPTEMVSFVYDIISWTYNAVNNDGSAGDKVGPKKWNLQTNKAD
ncbi:MAG: Hcp family type VI secretion system effector [Methylosarcina sp.]|jgi:type VI secretion system secreted protein Hcp